MFFFRGKEFQGLFMCFTMDAHIGNRVHPVACGGVQRIQAMRQLQTGEEVFLYVTHAGFDPSFFVAFAHVAGAWAEAIVSRKV